MQIETEMFWMELFVEVWNYRHWNEAQKVKSIVANFV